MNKIENYLTINGFKCNQIPYLLVIDEYTSFCLVEGKEVLENMSKLLNMAREYNIFVIISANRRRLGTIQTWSKR